ncbi:MAG TPA: amino acid adenylation domain-containing protein, partial [Steroidobacteraceae bacterium]
MIERWVEAQQQRGIQLQELPWRVAVHVLSRERFHLSLATHHALLDGWSERHLIAELLTHYRLLCNGKLPRARTTPPSYAESVARELEALANDTSRAFWVEQLKGASLPRWAGSTRAGNTRLQKIVGKTLSGQMASLAKQWGVQEKSLWCAVYAALLAVVDGNEQILGGVVTHSRPELEGVAESLGPYLNTLPLTCNLYGRSWRDIATQIDQALQAQFRHRFYPLARIQIDTGLDLASSLFNFIEFEPASGAGVDTVPHRMSSFGKEQTNFLVAFTVEKNAGGGDATCITLDVDNKVWAEGLRRKLLPYLERILQRITATATRHFVIEDILEETERSRLIAWKQTAADFHLDQCVHELFERQVGATPEAIALVYEEQAISFRELNHRANFLARHLLSLNLPLETRVGLYFNRSIEMVIGLLAAAKSGACYVPLDPGHPQERTQFILTDADVRVVLSNIDSPGLQSQQRRWIDIPALLSQAYASTRRYDNIPRSDIGLNPDNLAYWLYTSGSMGRPKGVMIRHAALSNLCQDSVRRRGFNGECRNLQFAPLSFDASNAEIFNSLSSGSVLHIPQISVLTDAEEFRAYSKRHSINRGYIPPAFLGILDKNDFSSYRSLSVGGEAIPGEIAKQWSQSTTLTNAYGPTECTIACTSGILDGSADVSIGTFLTNVHGYVLNDALQLIPMGVVGELCIAGECLARGYAGDGRLTAEKFLPNPFSDKPGSRLYRTGDLVRYRDDGNLEFVGRKDNQIKLRGYRIELGEIESHMTRHPLVKAAVASVQGAGEDRKLVVHYTMEADGVTAPTVADLRAFAQQGLPHYMIPAAFARIDKLPLTANGKVDRRSLPPIELNAVGADVVPPRGEIETGVAAIWAELLEVKRVGRFDDFFDLGGHSLLATQLVFRVRARFTADVAIRDLFENPTLHRFAAVVESRKGTVTCQDLAPNDATAPRLSSAQQRLWFLSRMMPANGVYNISLARKLRGDLDEAALLESLRQIVNRHDALRARFIDVQGQPVQVIDAPLESCMVVEEVASEEDLRAQRAAEREYCFDLSRGPLYRLRLLRTRFDGQWALFVTMHHIVADAWSMGVFFKELSRLYRGAVAGQNVALEPLPMEYADYAQWQRQQLQGEALQRQLDYWKSRLADVPASLDLPTDFPRPSEQSYRGDSVALALSDELSEQLNALSRQYGVTLFMTLLAAFSVLLSRRCREDDIAIGTPIANRTRKEAEDLIGFFVNMLVLRCDLRGRPTFTQVLTRTREMALQAYAHQDVPFEHLVEALNPGRSLNRTPLFQVAFGMQNTPREAVRMGAVEMTPLFPESRKTVSRYDMTLNMDEGSAGLTGVLEYCTDLFTRDTIENLLEQYVALLEQVARNPQLPIDQYGMLTKWDEHIYREALHGLGEHGRLALSGDEWAPDQIILEGENGRYTAADIVCKADGLAHLLASQGAVAGECIGIVQGTDSGTLVAWLAVRKLSASAYFIPPGVNALRRRFLCASAGVTRVLNASGSGHDVGDLDVAPLLEVTPALSLPFVPHSRASLRIHVRHASGRALAAQWDQEALLRSLLRGEDPGVEDPLWAICGLSRFVVSMLKAIARGEKWDSARYRVAMESESGAGAWAGRATQPTVILEGDRLAPIGTAGELCLEDVHLLKHGEGWSAVHPVRAGSRVVRTGHWA